MRAASWWVLAAALVAGGCGGDEGRMQDPGPEPGAAAPEATVTPIPAAVPAQLERVPTVTRERTDTRAERLASMPPPEPPFILDVGAAGFADEGARAHVLAAALSCGWWVTAKGTAQITGGAFSVQLTDALMGDFDHGVFIYVDRDGDEVCDTSKGDLLFMTQVVGAQPMSLSVDASTLTPAHGWECLLFEDYAG